MVVCRAVCYSANHPHSFCLPFSRWRGHSSGQWGHSFPFRGFLNSQIWPDAPLTWGADSLAAVIPLTKRSPCFILASCQQNSLHQRLSDQIWLIFASMAVASSSLLWEETQVTYFKFNRATCESCHSQVHIMSLTTMVLLLLANTLSSRHLFEEKWVSNGECSPSETAC